VTADATNITTSPHHHCLVDGAGCECSSSDAHHSNDLSALLDSGGAASLEIKVALLAIPHTDCFDGFTTADTVITWQNANGRSHRFIAADLPVIIIDSHEDVVVLTAGNEDPQHVLRFVVFVSRPNPTKIRYIDRTKPHHLEITVPVFKPSSDGFAGSIGSCMLTYEPMGRGTEPSASIPTNTESEK
jgi:hypothetical protein